MKFGTSGIRGIVPSELDENKAYILGLALAKFFGKGKKGIIGRDSRSSGAMLEKALVKGLRQRGADAVSTGISSTPALSWLAIEYDFGVMITASHNPSKYNGFKVYQGSGRQTTIQMENDIEKLIKEFEGEKLKEDDRPVQSVDLNKKYVEKHLLTDFKYSFDTKFVLDCANGSGAEMLKFLGSHLRGVMPVCTGGGDDINKDCGAAETDKLCELVAKDKSAVCGFALDGDADRFSIVDKNGKLISTDRVIYGITKTLFEEGKLRNNTVAYTVFSSIALDKALNKLGIKVIRTPVGDRFVSDAIMQNNLKFGAEASGHFLFENLATSDGLYTMLFVLEHIRKNPNFLENMQKGYEDFARLDANLHKTQEQSKAKMENEQYIKLIDEVKQFLSDDGYMLIRQSGTEPVLRIMVEHREKNKAQEALNRLLAYLE